MKYFRTILAASFFSLLIPSFAFCVSQTSQQLPPVETQKPNTDYKPAFEGQTRIAGVKTTTPYEVTVIADNLTAPWAVTLLPDGRLAITEKAGTLRIATTDGQVSEPISGFSEVDDRKQGGLLDVAPAPDFTTSRIIYFTLAEKTSQGSLTAVGRGRLSEDEKRIENFLIIYRAVPYYDNSMHFGGRILFDDNGNIFISTGERSDPIRITSRPTGRATCSTWSWYSSGTWRLSCGTSPYVIIRYSPPNTDL
jgi:Glucose/sorbosone dehydrogenases